MSKPEFLSLKVFFSFLMGFNDFDTLVCCAVLQVFQTVMFMTLCWCSFQCKETIISKLPLTFVTNIELFKGYLNILAQPGIFLTKIEYVYSL